MPIPEKGRRSPANNVQPGVGEEKGGQVYRRKIRLVQEERRQGIDNTTEVEKASKNANKEEKLKLTIMHRCSYGNMKEKKKKKEAQTEEGNETAQSQRKEEEAEHNGQERHSQEARGIPGGTSTGEHLDTGGVEERGMGHS